MIENTIVILIIGSLIIFIFLVLTIIISIVSRRHRSTYNFKVEIVLAKVLGKLLKNIDQPIATRMIKILKKELRSKQGFRTIANKLVTLQNLVMLSPSEKPLSLINAIGLDSKIQRNLKSKNKYTSASALKLSYELGLYDHLPFFLKSINSKNRVVRREAQLGLTVFKGWESLEFFKSIQYSISLWQMIRILDALESHPLPHNTLLLESTLNATNRDVVLLGYYCCKRFNLLNEHPKFLELTQSTIEHRFAFAKAEPLLIPQEELFS